MTQSHEEWLQASLGLESMTEAALRRDGLGLRSLVQDFLGRHSNLSAVSRPESEDLQLLGTAAALIELLAERRGQAAPAWASAVGGVPEPMFLLEAASRMSRLRSLCETESPEPLRRRGLYAPPDFLTFA